MERKLATAAISGGVLLGTLVVVLLAIIALHNPVKGELDRIRAAGEPVTFADLEPADVPEAENAAHDFLQAIDLMPAIQIGAAGTISAESDHQLFDSYEHADLLRINRAELLGTLDAFADAMAIAEKAALRPRCKFPIDYEASDQEDRRKFLSGPSMSHSAPMFMLKRLSGAKALLAAGSGRDEEAARYLRVYSGFCDALRSQMLWGHVHHLGTLHDLLQAMEESSESGLGEMSRVAALDILKPVDLGRLLRQDLLYTRVDWTNNLLLNCDVEISDSRAALTYGTLVGRYIIRRNAVHWLRASAEGIRLSAREPNVFLPALREASNRLEVLTNNRYPATRGSVSWRFSFESGQYCRTWTRHRLVLVGLACADYRSRHGAYPDRLESLVPDYLDIIPPDPFAARPLTYRKSGDGFIVYSVGLDTHDAGGKAWEDSEDDIAWRSHGVE